MSFLHSLAGANILIFGAGVTGKPTEDFLRSRGALVTVLDERETGANVRNSIENLAWESFSLAVVSPGWKPDHPWITTAQKMRVPLLSEIDLAWRARHEIAPHQRWIGLTGTNGKTTTVQMAEALALAGNLKAQA